MTLTVEILLAHCIMAWSVLLSPTFWRSFAYSVRNTRGKSMDTQRKGEVSFTSFNILSYTIALYIGPEILIEGQIVQGGETFICRISTIRNIF